MKPERNKPCPCGSGRKYKKCCLPRWNKKKKVTDQELHYGEKVPVSELMRTKTSRRAQPQRKGEGARVRSKRGYFKDRGE